MVYDDTVLETVALETTCFLLEPLFYKNPRYDSQKKKDSNSNQVFFWNFATRSLPV